MTIAEEDRQAPTYVSSVYLKPKLSVQNYTSEVEIRKFPFKKQIYRSGVTIYRRYFVESQPFIEIDCNNNKNSEVADILWQSTAVIVQFYCFKKIAN